MQMMGGDCVQGIAVEVVGFADGVAVGVVGADGDAQAQEMVPLYRVGDAHVYEVVWLEAGTMEIYGGHGRW